ncbi:MAG: hypothetical protein AUJ02_09885 [Chloroflexi bacterium 13_1_40CM_3_65_12]|nr:MAG: hypothetical protein AUJ02_09885 [Chloroflexi bacterium 13_1_40CM_3_65_12]OLD50625.1 MAG: hypothetical protein AUI42_02465 [Actinobacteria bacterium 13_1_40CM_2_65_8]
MVLLIGPFVAAVGLVAVFFVMRHRSVQTKSMYSSRRAQIERKVRAARQRTLTPTGKSAASAAPQTFVSPGMEAKGAIPTATWGAPTVGPAPVAPPGPEPVWEVGPTTPAPSAPPPPAAPEPRPPTFAPPESPYAPAPQQEVWSPAPVESFEPVAPPRPEPAAAPVETPAGAGASWSIVSDSKDVTEEAVTGASKKRKKDKKADTGSWQLASGGAPGDEGVDEIKVPSSAIAVAQYAVLVVGLVMVLIGVLVMVANAHVT